MALTVEDGSGIVGAESYTSVASTDTHFTDNPYAAVWTAATTARKEWALRSASRLLDAHMKWEGTRGSTTQGLEWPRTDAVDRCTQDDIAENIVPANVIYATQELALDLLTSDKTRPAGTDQSLISKVKIDSVEVSYDTPLKNGQRYATPSVMSDAIKPLLRCLGTVAYDTQGGIKFGTVVRHIS